MPGYSVENLKEIEDSAVAFGLSPDVEARFARAPLGAERSGVSFQRLAPGVRQSFGHRHADQEETYVVLAGAGRVKLGDEVVDLRPWDALRVSPDVMRCFEAGPDGLELLAFGAGEAGEAEVVPGWWAY
ncbi:MAG TPA: cupin domain-containing protein [Gaiellaceae bacterium]|nr:cupin domain-containing protein [Gaiellaceae bacterium]